MQYFKRIYNSDFIILLKSSMYNSKSLHDRTTLDTAYEQFLVQVNKIARSKKSHLEKLRMLTLVYERVDLAKTNLSDHTSIRYYYAQSVCAILNFEKKAILLQLKYPNTILNHYETREPPFRLSKKYTPTDLMEIITPLHAIGFFCQPDGSPVSFADLTKELETLCGIKFKNPETCRWAVLNRKNKLTHIIDTLRRTLLELSIK